MSVVYDAVNIFAATMVVISPYRKTQNHLLVVRTKVCIVLYIRAELPAQSAPLAGQSLSLLDRLSRSRSLPLSVSPLGKKEGVDALAVSLKMQRIPEFIGPIGETRVANKATRAVDCTFLSQLRPLCLPIPSTS